MGSASVDDINYWANELSEIPVLEMVTDKERAPVLTKERGCVDFSIPIDISLKLRQLSLSQGCDILPSMAAIFAICLCRHTTQGDVCIGHETDSGFLALRLEINGNNSFLSILNSAMKKVRDGVSHGKIAFPDVVKAANLLPDTRRNLIYQTMINFYAEKPFPVEAPDNICEFVLEIRDAVDGSFDAKLYYSSDLYNLDTAERFSGHFRVLMKGIVDSPAIPVDALVLLTEGEIAEYQSWNTTDVNFGPFMRVDRMFEEIAFKFPNNQALRLDGQALSFQEVNIAASKLADKLFNKGIEAYEKVGLVLDRSFDMFIAILAVVKIGAIIVPIDIAHTPPDRIEYMFTDSAVRFVIVHDVHEPNLIDICADKFTMLSWSTLEAEDSGVEETVPFRPPEVDLDTEAVFGIYYTSGTTGRPKGVMNMHRNVFNLVKAYSKYSNIQKTDRILQFASYSFIQSLRQIWPTLCSGACLVLVRNPLLFGNVINQEKVNKLVITSSALSLLNPTKHPTLEVIQLGGEAVPLKLALSWNQQVRFMVGLGPTELTAHACCNPMITDTMNIGTPHDNVRCYITNSKMQLQPKGCVGELCIAGANVAKGYLNLAAATTEKFIQNPFIDKPEILYKTGDLAMRLGDGNLFFIGRRDDQIKIHGYRIELAEVQRAIEQATGVEKAAVLVMNDQLCAYVSPASCEESAIKKFLASRLPKYMVPSHVVVLERFPLNKNGKLDRTALPNPFTASITVNNNSGNKRVPQTQMESITTAAFHSALNLSPNQIIYATDNFFDLGGSSLTVAILARHLSERTNIEVSIIDIFEKKTAEDVAKFFDANKKGSSRAEDKTYWKYRVGEDSQDSEKPIAPWLYGLMQFWSIAIVFLIQVGPVIALVIAFDEILFQSSLPLYLGMLLIPLLLFVAAIAVSLIVIVFKWLMIGRFQPGVYPMYSHTFFKWWLNRKLMSSSSFWIWVFTETPLFPLFMRLLGSKIGSNAYMDMVDMEEPDLITIGNNFIGRFESVLCTSEIIEKSLVLRRVEIADDVCLGQRAILLPGAKIAENVEIMGGSSVDGTARVEKGTTWLGNPGKCIGAREKAHEKNLPAFLHSTWYHLLQVLNIYALLFHLQWPFIVLALIVYQINSYNFIFVPGFIGLFGSVPVIVTYLFMVIISKWVLTCGSLTANKLYSGPFFFLRRWLVDRLLVNPIFTYLQPTLLTYCSIGPMYFRLLGVKIGSQTWMAPPMFDMGCSLVNMGEHPHMGQHNVFFTAVVTSDGVMFDPINIGDHVTFGQRSVMAPGVVLGDNSTVGALTFLPPKFQLSPRHTACGCPPILFETTSDTKIATNAQLQAMAKNEVRKSIVAQDFPSGFNARNSMRQSVMEHARPSISTMKPEKDMYRTSLFQQNEKQYSSAPQRDLEAGSSDSTEVSCCARWLFSFCAISVKLLLPAVMALCFTGVLYFWKYLVLQVSSSVWLAVLLPLTYLSGTLLVTMLLLFFASIGFLNFRSGLMDYFSVGFFHWYIMTDIQYGWMQMLLALLSGTRFYISMLRWMGADIGQDTYIDIPGGLREIDNIILKDRAILLSRFIYAHYIDNGKLQFAPVIIESDVCINKECMIMPLTTYKSNSILRPYSSTLKGQVFGSNRIYQGAPAAKGFDVSPDNCRLSIVRGSEVMLTPLRASATTAYKK